MSHGHLESPVQMSKALCWPWKGIVPAGMEPGEIFLQLPHPSEPRRPLPNLPGLPRAPGLQRWHWGCTRAAAEPRSGCCHHICLFFMENMCVPYSPLQCHLWRLAPGMNSFSSCFQAVSGSDTLFTRCQESKLGVWYYFLCHWSGSGHVTDQRLQQCFTVLMYV